MLDVDAIVEARERHPEPARDLARVGRDRLAGVELGGASRDKVAIVRHPDVRRMLLQMKSRTEALRAVACSCIVVNAPAITPTARTPATFSLEPMLDAPFQ